MCQSWNHKSLKNLETCILGILMQAWNPVTLQPWNPGEQGSSQFQQGIVVFNFVPKTKQKIQKLSSYSI